MAALSARRPRYNVRLIDEPVAAAAGAGFDLTGGAGGFVVDIGGGTTEVAAVAGWRVVRSRSLRKAGNAMDDAIVHAARNELGLIISQRAARHLKTTLGVTGGADGSAEVVGLDVAHRTPRSENVPGGLVAAALEPIVAAIAGTVHEMLSEIPAGLAEDVVAARSGWPAAARCCPAWPPGSRPRPASARSWSRTRCGAWSAARRRSWSARTRARSPGPACVSSKQGGSGGMGPSRGSGDGSLPRGVRGMGPPGRNSGGSWGSSRASDCPYSSGCLEMAGGSRPASSQPTTAAITGMPTTMNSRFSVGTLDSSERPSRGLSQA